VLKKRTQKSFSRLVFIIFFFISLYILSIFLLNSSAASKELIETPSDEPFTYPLNWGGTGLMEIPTARI